MEALCLDYDFLTFSEHWFSKDELSVIKIANFNLISNFCRSVKTRGGVAIYASSNILKYCRNLKALSSLSVESEIEICAMESAILNVVLVTIYRPPSGNINLFISVLAALLDILDKTNRLVIIMGDFNIDTLVDVDAGCCLFIDLIRSYNLNLTLSEPTRGKACLDNVITNASDKYFLSYIIDYYLSDHKSIVFEFEVSFEKDLEIRKDIRPITHHGLNLLHNHLVKINWDFIKSNDSIDEKCNTFLNILHKACEESFPIKQIKAKSENSMSNCWFSQSLKEFRDYVNSLRCLYSITNDPNLNALYKKERNKYRRTIQLAKLEANNNFIKSATNISKASWKIINTYRPSKYVHQSPGQNTCEDFNKYFSEIALNLQKNFPHPNVINNIQHQFNVFNFSPVSYNNVRDVIINLKNSSTLDIYLLNAKILKSIVHIIVYPLTNLLNLSINQNIYPSALKISKTIPIFKKGDKNKVSNYRPISITPLISKVFEKCLFTQLNNHVESNNILSPCQYGFRHNKSTTSAICALTNMICDAFEHKCLAGCCFYDLTKAFDCVSGHVLARRLEQYNFSQESVKLINSFLNDRQQLVHYNNVSSGLLQIPLGVPQGSVLGPLLFLLYINQLPNDIPDTSFILFADDTSTFACNKNATALMNKLQQDEHNLQNWFVNNVLTLNNDKTIKCLFSVKPIQTDDYSKYAKFLGVTLDEGLLWSKHIDVLSLRLSSSIYQIRQLSRVVSAHILKIAYFAIFHSSLSYAILAWGHSSHASRAFKLQRRVIRVLKALPFDADCRHAFVELGILTTPCIYIYACLVYVHANVANYTKRGEISCLSTRHADDLQVDFHRIARSRNAHNYWGPTLYNKLPKTCRLLSLHQFKYRVKSLLLTRAFYSVQEYCDTDLSAA